MCFFPVIRSLLERNPEETTQSGGRKTSPESSRRSSLFFFLSPRRIDALYLPRFSISSDYKLEEILPRLGIKKIFSAEADLSGITDTTPLCVSQVSLHTLDNSSSLWGAHGGGQAGVQVTLNLPKNCISYNSIISPGKPQAQEGWVTILLGSCPHLP